MRKNIKDIPAPVNRSEEVMFQMLIRLDEIVVELKKQNKNATPTTRKRAVKKNDATTVDAKS